MAELERDQSDHQEIAVLTAEIVGADGGNHVTANDLPDVIAMVGKGHSALDQAVASTGKEKPTLAVPIKRSVTPDHIICLEDGERPMMLQWHSKTRYDMTTLGSERQIPDGCAELCRTKQRSDEEYRSWSEARIRKAGKRTAQANGVKAGRQERVTIEPGGAESFAWENPAANLMKNQCVINSLNSKEPKVTQPFILAQSSIFWTSSVIWRRMHIRIDSYTPSRQAIL